MVVLVALAALVRKNLLIMRRNPISSVFQILAPTMVIVALLAIKNSVGDGTYAPSVSPATNPSIPDIPLSFGDYLTYVQSSSRRCRGEPPYWVITNYSPFSPFVVCNPTLCQEDGEDADNYCQIFQLGIAALTDSPELQKVVDEFADFITSRYPLAFSPPPSPNFPPLVKRFASNAAINSYISSETYTTQSQPQLGGAIVISTSSKSSFSYKIRVNTTFFSDISDIPRPNSPTTPDTRTLFDPFAKSATNKASCLVINGGPLLPIINSGEGGQISCYGMYMLNGAITMQRLVDDFALHLHAGDSVVVSEAGVAFVNYPAADSTEQGFWGLISDLLPLIFVIAMAYPILRTTKIIVLEKELKLKEFLLIQGVTSFEVEAAWFISVGLHFAVIASCMSIPGCSFFSNSSPAIIIVFFFLAMFATLAYCFAISSLFFVAKTGSLIGLLIYSAGYFLLFAVPFNTASLTSMNLASLHPFMAISYGAMSIALAEEIGEGINSENYSVSGNLSGYNFGNAAFMLVVDFVYLMVLSWWFGKVLVGEYGVKESPLFCLRPSYWFPSRFGPASTSNQNQTEETSLLGGAEAVPESLSMQDSSGECITIKNLRREFGHQKLAIDNLTMSVYKGQITCLLGHNGAGKSTLVNILTGQMLATSGKAVVCGKEVGSETAAIRQFVGLCPQHDTLWSDLTVREHVQLFARIKGVFRGKTAAEANDFVTASIESVALGGKVSSLAGTLSGGMKRKLHVAIAFSGANKVVILDEPTSGMDPFSRRFTWDVIRRNSANRIVLLTTHFMEEADLLGDRIAIMAEGQLRVIGTSLFLKQLYGVGYQLTIECGSPSSHTTTVLTETVNNHCANANLLSSVGKEIAFQLPLAASKNFYDLMTSLNELKLQATGLITTYGVSVTTLEAVFLMVAKGVLPNSTTAVQTPPPSDLPTSTPTTVTILAGKPTFSRQSYALLTKRALDIKRNKRTWCCGFILPIFVNLCGFFLYLFGGRGQNFPPLSLSLADQNPTIQEFANPLLFNEPNSVFECRPGNCISDGENLNLDFEELLVVCQTRLNLSLEYCESLLSQLSGVKDVNACGALALPTGGNCTISDSSANLGLFTPFGASLPIYPVAVESVSATSNRLAKNLDEVEFKASQYGSIIFNRERGSTYVNENGTSVEYAVVTLNRCLAAVEAGLFRNSTPCEFYVGLSYYVALNFTALHTSLLYQGLADEQLVKEHGVDVEENFELLVEVDPLPFTRRQDDLGAAEQSFTIWFLLVFSFPFIIGTCSTFVVRERETKSLLLQSVSGVSPFAYWMTTYVFDFCCYLLPFSALLVMLFAFDVKAFTTTANDALTATILLLLFFGPAAISSTYLLTYSFKSPSSAQYTTIFVNFFVGLVGAMLVFILSLVNPEKFLQSVDTISFVLRLFPSFCLARGLLYIINIEGISLFVYEGKSLTCFTPEIMLTDLIFLAVEGVVYIALVIGLAYLDNKVSDVDLFGARKRKLKRCAVLEAELELEMRESPNNQIEIDEEVIAEERKVNAIDVDNDNVNDNPIVTRNVKKVYSDGKVAVAGVSLAIEKNEIFGLLGVNGAGKTSFIGLLCGEFKPSEGDVFINGLNLNKSKNLVRCRRELGFCPQFDAHFDKMTGREHVRMYANLKGLEAEHLEEIVSSKLAQCGLNEADSDKISSEYSGGMRRKLSVAIATVANPPVVVLDEPSTGMDPVSRREMWDLVKRLSEKGDTCILLTTHSMEECESLSNRIGIMKAGKLKCIGSSQGLKSRYGEGFEVALTLAIDFGEELLVIAKRDVLAELQGDEDGDRDGDGEERADHGSTTLNECLALVSKLGGEKMRKQLSVNSALHQRLLHSENLLINDEDLMSEISLFVAIERHVESVHVWFESNFSMNVVERNNTQLRYHIVEADDIQLKDIFGKIEECKEDLGVGEYAVSQTTLEAIFNKFAKDGDEEES